MAVKLREGMLSETILPRNYYYYYYYAVLLMIMIT
jgi:hypothetical protein